jgi:hypothetical protein
MGAVFAFKVVVEPTPEPDHIELLFASPEESTAELAPRQNTGVVWCTRSADTLAVAVVDAIAEVEALGLRAVRVEAQPWVTLDDIARRLGRPGAAVRQWATTEPGPGAFPLPLVHDGPPLVPDGPPLVHDGPPLVPDGPPLASAGPPALWYWPQVARWLRDTLGYHLPDDHTVLAAVSIALRLRELTPQVPGMRALRRLLPP